MLSTKIREKSAGRKGFMRLLAVILLTAVAVFFTMGDSALAKKSKREAEELDPVNVFIEYNDTDGDQGIQFFWDSDGFTRMMVFDASWKKVLDVETKNSVKDQGLTEVAIESVEPDYSDQTLEEFLERFPAGTYRFWGRSIEVGWIYGEADFTHDLVEPVEIDLWDWPTIKWYPGDDEDVDVVGYEVVVELVVTEVNGEDGEERVFKQTTTLPAVIRQLTVSPEFVRMIRFYKTNSDKWDMELKVEILADEESGNRTITELGVCFDQPDNACLDD